MSFSSAAIGLKFVIEFMGGEDHGESIRSEAIGITDVVVYGAAFRVVRGRGEPEIGNDPHAQQIVAEISKGAVAKSVLTIIVISVNAVGVAAVHGVAVGSEPPILPQLRSGNIGNGVAIRVLGIGHRKARRGRRQQALHAGCTRIAGKYAIRELVERCISFKVGDDFLLADSAGIETHVHASIEVRAGSYRDVCSGILLDAVKAAVDEAHRARVLSFKSTRFVDESQNGDELQGFRYGRLSSAGGDGKGAALISAAEWAVAIVG